MARSSVSASRPLSSWNGSSVCAYVSSVPTYDGVYPTDPLSSGHALDACTCAVLSGGGGNRGEDGRRTAGTCSSRFRSHSVSVLTALHLTTSDMSARGRLYSERRAWATERRHLSSKMVSWALSINGSHRALFWAFLCSPFRSSAHLQLSELSHVVAPGEVCDINALWNQGEREGRPAVSVESQNVRCK